MLNEEKKLLKIFSYLKDFSILAEKKTRKYNIKDVDFNFDFEKINKENQYFKLCFDADQLADNQPVLTVVRPDIIQCPEPSEDLQQWLLSDWSDHHVEKISVKKEMEIDDKLVEFSDTKFAHEFDLWIIKRKAWLAQSLEIEEARSTFDEFYRFYQQMSLQKDTHELYFGSHFLKSMDGLVDYPFVLRPAKIFYDIDSKELKLVANNEGSKIQRSLLDQLSDIDLKDFKELNDEFELLDPHPFDMEAVGHFIEPLLNSLTPFSKYLNSESYQQFNKNDENLIIYERNSMLFTSRSNAIVQYLDTAVKSIEEENYPKHLLSFVNPNRSQEIIPAEEAKGLERLANLGGESIDILLAKEANEEQLNIIKRLQQGHDGVLVQGPPGTGKTHTIANITGHLLSEGKTVLITSKSHKALSVLKDKLPLPIQALAVSLIDDNQEDMENSINKINEKVSSENVLTLEKKINNLEQERIELMEELGSYREKILSIKVQESESVVVAGKSMSLTELAQFISENESTLNIIPGKVVKSDQLPLSVEELEELYLTNLSLSESEEKEFVLGLVDPKDLITPEEFNDLLDSQKQIEDALVNISQHTEENYEFSEDNLAIRIRKRGYPFFIKGFSESIENELETFILGIENLEGWSKDAIIAGEKAENHLIIWEDLKDSIKSAYHKENLYVSKLFSNEIVYTGELSNEEIAQVLPEMISKHGSFGFSLSKNINKKYKDILNNFKLNGMKIESKEDLELVFSHVDLKIHENNLTRYWNALIGNFESIEASYNTLEDIDYYLRWTKTYDEFSKKMVETGIQIHYLFDSSTQKTVEEKLEKVIDSFKLFGKSLHQIVKSLLDLERLNSKLVESLDLLKHESSSSFNNLMIKALSEKNITNYQTTYLEVSETYYKSITANRREALLLKLQESAPAWALAIRERKGVHGNEHVPVQIEEAWRFKQYSKIIDEVLNYNYNDLLDASYHAGQKFREKTAELAAEKAWHALILRTKEDRELQTTLKTWQMYMARIGKGTGKRAARYRRHARDLMTNAQKAIPTWIMPLDQVMNNMTPGINKFDVVIIDEASQANITDLGSLFLGEKVIVVGDDRQVSPTSFLRDDEIQSLKKTYFEEEEMKQFDILDGETSLYDLVGTIYESLMLKEHFRCVPEIIDFSSFDSYDGQISALRGSNTAQVFPPLVEFRVENGQFQAQGNFNEAEAQAIGAIVLGMTKTEAYKNSTIGVITMLSSSKQEELILKEIAKQISPDEMEKRKIIVGRSSSFQGDERDVMILSLVQSNDSESPLRFHGPDVNNRRKKIYNVAVSRARDQLWVVHSLDLQKDLKHGDYRRKLIEHARNPYFKEEKINALSDSPFEKEVAMALIGRGYKIEQQKKVGTFRIDMVAYGKKEQVAIECDGERYHSGQEKLMEDLERQTVLERIGWTFIRLRGSEYYRDKEKAIDRVCKELESLGVESGGMDQEYFGNQTNMHTPELNEVLNHAASTLKEDPEKFKKTSLPFYDPNIKESKMINKNTHVQKQIQTVMSSEIVKEVDSVKNQIEVEKTNKEPLTDKDNKKESQEADLKTSSSVEVVEKETFPHTVKPQDTKEISNKDQDLTSLKINEKKIKSENLSPTADINIKDLKVTADDENISQTSEGYHRYSAHRLGELEKNLSKTKYKIGIVDHLGIISEPSSWNIELNLVTWSSKSVVYDLRKWKSDHKQIGKGITMSASELKKLDKILKEVISDE